MKVAGLVMFSSALLLGGCAAYPDGPMYGGGYPVYDDPGYAAYPAYPAYYGGPVVQPGVVIGGGYYSGPRRYWDDSPGYRRPPPGGWNNRPRGDGYPNRGGQAGGPPQRGGGGGPPPQASAAPLPQAVGGVRPHPPQQQAPQQQQAPSRGGGGGGGGHGGNDRGLSFARRLRCQPICDCCALYSSRNVRPTGAGISRVPVHPAPKGRRDSFLSRPPMRSSTRTANLVTSA